MPREIGRDRIHALLRASRADQIGHRDKDDGQPMENLRGRAVTQAGAHQRRHYKTPVITPATWELNLNAAMPIGIKLLSIGGTLAPTGDRWHRAARGAAASAREGSWILTTNLMT